MGKERFDRSEPHVNLGTIGACPTVRGRLELAEKEIESLKEQLEEARSDIEIMMMASNQITVQHLGRQCLEKYKRGKKWQHGIQQQALEQTEK